MFRIAQEPADLIRVRFNQTLLGAAIIAVGLVVAWLFLDTCTIHLSRAEDGKVNCRIENTRPLQKRTRLVRNLKRAVVQTHNSHSRQADRNERSFRAMLISAGGEEEHPVTAYTSSNRQPHQELVEAVNRFVQDPTAKSAQHTIGLGYGWLILLVPAMGACIALGFRGECVIDPMNRTVTLTHWRPWGSQRLSMPLDQVQAFRLLRRAGSQGSLSTPGIVCVDGSEIPFTQAWTSGASFASHALVERLNGFLAAHRSSGSSWHAEPRGPFPTHRVVPVGTAPATVQPEIAPILLPNQKICAICGGDCSQGERWRDDEGRYFHPACHAARQKQ